MKPHIHAAVIHAFADGAEVQVMTDFGEWKDCQYPDFDPHCKYQVKPAAPKWPQTTMTEEDLSRHITYRIGTGMSGPETGPFYTRLANEAIAHACETGQVVPNETVNKLMLECHRREGELRKALVGIHRMDTGERDMAIAINVRAACHAKLPGQVTNDELNRIISGTK